MSIFLNHKQNSFIFLSAHDISSDHGLFPWGQYCANDSCMPFDPFQARAKDVQVSWVSISQILSNQLPYLSLALKNVDDRMELIKKTNSVLKKGGF